MSGESDRFSTGISGLDTILGGGVFEGGIYIVSGERVERLAHMTDFDSDEALARFEQILAKMGVDKKLRELGVQEGDTVRIAGVEFDYS